MKKSAMIGPMQVPYRKPGKFSQIKPDLLVTPEKLTELTRKLDRLKNHTRPQAADEVARLAEMGDFSENAAYQMAKGRLRGINNTIMKLEHQTGHAIIIDPKQAKDTVEVGHTITVLLNNQEKIYTILGSAETDPEKGVISHTSPIGQALLGSRVGDTVTVQLAQREVQYKIMKIK